MPRTQEGSKFVTHLTALDSTSDTDVYVVPKNFSSHVENLMISNTNEKLANVTHTLFSAHPVTGKDFENVFTNTLPLYLHAEDKIIVAAETADTLTTLIAAEEFFDPVR